MSSLPTTLRRQLEGACKQARKIAGNGARKALESLAVHEPSPYRHMDAGQRGLRCKLQAQAQQLGDGESQTRRGAYEIKHLVEKLAYDQWHRLLFARFLMENNLLISPEHGVSVTLDDCEELAPSLGLKDAWAVAARFAAKELPEIFRDDDPAGAVELPVEDRNPLIQLVTGLPAEVFTASDSLGWCYQFWQAERKDEVNAAGNKIGADELPAVTQLFTEDYMVDFLLDNTLGAWHAGKVLAAKRTLTETAQSEEELRNAVALPGCLWRYLRFIKAEDGKWKPAAGAFDGWPKTAKELKCLDPCMGSGHFVVAMFERLAALRMVEEKLDEAVAVPAVIRDNLFGLEIDPRCTQIGAFNLALAAWRQVGHCKLPAMNLACSGLAPNAKKEDWLKLASDNDRLRRGMERLYLSFKDAPLLGSLINPCAVEGDLLEAAFHELQPLLDKALAQEAKDDTAREMAVTASGLAKAAEILAAQFTLVATNVPYLGRGKQDDVLKSYLNSLYSESKWDLATAFVERCKTLCAYAGTASLVTPLQWCSGDKYVSFRDTQLRRTSWNVAARLGTNAFETISGEVVNVILMVLSCMQPEADHTANSLDLSGRQTPTEKEAGMVTAGIQPFRQLSQLKNPDKRITFRDPTSQKLLGLIAKSTEGLSAGDGERFIAKVWERPCCDSGWAFLQTAPDKTSLYRGLTDIVLWEDGNGEMARSDAARIRGHSAWGKPGIVVAKMNSARASVYLGALFAKNCAVLSTSTAADCIAVLEFVTSPVFGEEVQRLDSNLNTATSVFEKVPFDPEHWQKVAMEKYPQGLPKPFSADPSQWVFDGHPKDSDQPLHVAVARLLGYQWPRQTGSGFPDCPALEQDGLEKLADQDGIVCLSATKGELPAAERLRAILAARGKGEFF